MSEPQRQPVLELHGISKRFGAVQALSGVDFEVFAGEVVALVGDNGAGKSTLVKVISGVYRPDSGRYIYKGREVTVNSPKVATDLGIETVYQDLALCDNLDVVANLFLGREKVAPLVPGVVSPIDEIQMEKTAGQVISDLHVRVQDVRLRVASLSGGQRQSVAVARAVMWNSTVVLMDEPTAALGVEQTRLVKDLILRLREKGLAVVVISHNLADVFDVSDRIIVLRLGRRVATLATRTSHAEQVVSVITGATFGAQLDEHGRPIAD
ncbi:MAG: ATP-binding cassette domain-containing protein [Chloroflexi bacterium]|nr:ATP-binding cassette domain-containing protein [Chloroflexota bacterium]MCL5109424.1 ATP-binding cassette domain-containing protein [Chloroflexota bacterium]